jgi:RNA polymerase sigma-70 factor (ECF subfamily)
MSVMIAEDPRIPLGKPLEFSWPPRAVRNPLGIERNPRCSASETAEGRPQPMLPPEKRNTGRCGHWDNQFADLIGPILGQLHRLARRILRTDDLAEDAVQEALFRLWREGRLPPNPTAWLSRAVIHRSLHLNRSRHRRCRHELRACLHRPEFDPSHEPSRAAEAEEISASINEALFQLSERLRTVFVLREIEQMDYESIAARLRIPLGTVRSRLARSREALQEALGRDGPEEW